MKAYIHNNQVKVGTEKPVIDVNNAHAWHRVMFDWESGLLDVENAEVFHDIEGNKMICIVNERKSYPAGMISNYKKDHDIIPIVDGQEVNYNKETKQITGII